MTVTGESLARDIMFSESFFEKLEENSLLCAVCLDVYKDPLILPECHHIFCRVCLERLPLKKKDGHYSFNCPMCAIPVSLPPNGVFGFQVSFQTVNLLDFVKANRGKSVLMNEKCDHCQSGRGSGYCTDCRSTFCTECTSLHEGCPGSNNGTLTSSSSSSIQSQSPQSVTQSNVTYQCTMHKRPLDTFCEHCEETICSKCVTGLQHTKHQSSCVPVRETLEKYRELLTDKLNPLNKKIDSISKQLKFSSQQESKIVAQDETVKAQIHSQAELLVGLIRKSEEELSAKVEKVTKSRLHFLRGRSESIEATLDELKNLKERVELCLETGNQEELLKTKQWIPKIDQVMDNIDASKLNPPKVTDLSFVPEKVLDNLTLIGNLSSTFESLDQSCDIKILDQFLFVNESPEVTIILSIKYSSLPFLVIPLSSVKCYIQLPSGSKSVEAKVSSGDAPGQYQIKFRPTINGYYKLSLSIDGVEAEDQSVLVPFNPMYFTRIKPTVIMKTGRYPIGLAVSRDKQIIVLNDYNELIMMDENGGNSKVYSRPAGGDRFSSCRDAAVTSDGCFLMTDKYSILKVTMDGRLVKTIGKRGSGNLQFNTPFGITIDQNTGKVYVADLYNHRIQVLNSDYTFSHTFGSRGNAMGQFQQPNSVALDSQGNVFVTDTFNHRIQKFTQQGKYLFLFGSEGSNPGQLKLPERIVINNDYVYVTEHVNSRVSVFTTEGKFIRCFGKDSSEGGIVWPRGLTFDEDGSLYVCDYKLHCIFKY